MLKSAISVRTPVVAGQFYPGTKDSLVKEVRALIQKNINREDAIGVVSPHAGYMYSGPVAGSVLSAIQPKKHYVILGPNHTGSGAAFGISKSKAWATPLGLVEVYTKLAEAILANCDLLELDDNSHLREHSIEVQLPFLQELSGDFDFVPMVVAQESLSVYRQVGNAIAKSIKELGIEKDTVIIASSDMTHYESQDEAKRKDSAAIDAILKLDDKKLIDNINALNISMCGYAPAAIMLSAVLSLGAKNARLVRYQTSGDVTGDYSAVVGYAGIIIY